MSDYAHPCVYCRKRPGVVALPTRLLRIKPMRCEDPACVERAARPPLMLYPQPYRGPDALAIDLARDFSRTPGGRYESDGPHSAEEFRRVHLEPAVARGVPVTVDLDGALGFGSSFLEEAFGGLVRKYGREVAARVTIVSTEHPGRAAKAQAFMDEEADRQEKP